MRPLRRYLPAACAILSLGFVGHSPWEPGTFRHISSSCGDPTLSTTSIDDGLPGLSAGLFSGVQSDASQQAESAYALFLEQLSINAAVAPLSSPASVLSAASLSNGLFAPFFPSYSLGAVNLYPVDLTKPDSSSLAWSNFESAPQLKYLLNGASPAAAPSALSAASPAIALIGGNAPASPAGAGALDSWMFSPTSLSSTAVPFSSSLVPGTIGATIVQSVAVNGATVGTASLGAAGAPVPAYSSLVPTVTQAPASVRFAISRPGVVQSPLVRAGH